MDCNKSNAAGTDRSFISERKALLRPRERISPLTQIKMNLFSWCTCRKQLHNRNLVIDLLAMLFGTSAWVAVNGMFVQLPLLVQTQPEGWNLPSYLSVIVQIANIGPVLYSISQKMFPNKFQDSSIIYGVLIMGSVAVFLLGFLYKKTTILFGTLHSTSLLFLQFFISLVGCTSSVLFMPFMSNFREIYLISYFVGEGLSGFIPSITALIQGVGGNPSCKNHTTIDEATNTTSETVISYIPPPKFSSEVFFFFLFSIMFLSTLAFFLLNNLPTCKNDKALAATSCRKNPNKETSLPSNNGSYPLHEEEISNVFNSTNAITTDLGADHKRASLKYTVYQSSDDKLSQMNYHYLLALAAWVGVLGNGIFPSIQSYSCLPYGNVAYHLSVTLSSMANPLACFLAFFVSYNSVQTILCLTAVSTLISLYIATTAFMSPSPVLKGTAAGEILVVVAWVMFTGFISYVKVSIASLFRREPGRALYWCGAVQQMGSACGAIVTFFLVNFTKIFQPYLPCQ